MGNEDKNMFVSIGKAATLLGVSTSTLRRWDRRCKLPAEFRTVGRHRRYDFTKLLAFVKKAFPERPRGRVNEDEKPRVVTYARVSGSKQKKDLELQIAHVRAYAEERGWTVVKSYKDVDSGLNDRRTGLLRLINDLPVIGPSKIVVSYSDRLARFGTRVIEALCTIFNAEIVVTHEEAKSMDSDQQLTRDVIALITSFAGKLHRSRRGRQTT